MTSAALLGVLVAVGSAPWVSWHRVPRAPWVVGASSAARSPSVGTAVAPVARPGPAREPDPLRVDLAVLFDLVAIALVAGVPVPRALDAVGHAVGGSDGRALRSAGAALCLGASWAEAWRSCPPRLHPLREALGRVWLSGASPAGVLRAASDQLRRARKRAVGEAAARLGARLVIPLGLCHLPAFVLLGLVPVLISLGRGLA